MLILCRSKYIRLASCVHNSTYIMHSISCTQEYKMHSEQSPRKTICDLKCKLTANQNVFVHMRKACCILQ